ncbi:MAG: D-alanyl-D-alanine carboxypeptidase/D-alanyl-D-alanine-endopeptidase [Actinomycetales bacterium]
MSRTSKLLTSLLLVVLLAVLAVPVVLHVAPGLFPPEARPAARVPDAQQLPASLAAVTGVGALSGAAPVPVPAQLAALLDSAFQTNDGVYTATVRDAATGTVLYDRGGDVPSIPASNLKLVTAVAALKTLGADHRFSTRVLSTAPGALVLQAGGDVLLAPGHGTPNATMGHAGVADLAKETASALAARGVGSVTLAVDDTLFSGPAVNPHWLQGDLDAGQIAPVYPMALYGARFDPAVSVGNRPQDSSMNVAAAFATALAADGVKVTGGVVRAAAGATATPIASVQSATVAQQVEYMLQASDNYVAEAMARLTAVGLNQPATVAGATAAVEEVAGKLGLPLAGLVMGDASGLAPDDRISANQLAALVRIILDSDGTDVRQAILGLPIAGLSGTLGDRYLDQTTVGGAGLVRAKTGTLNAALTLTGYVVDEDGRLLVFSFMANELAGGSSAAKPVVDRAATVLAGCGCR